MKTLRFVLCVAGLLAALPASAKPKHILISDSTVVMSIANNRTTLNISTVYTS